MQRPTILEMGSVAGTNFGKEGLFMIREYTPKSFAAITG
jgi:hypothetical protein